MRLFIAICALVLVCADAQAFGERRAARRAARQGCAVTSFHATTVQSTGCSNGQCQRR